MTINEDALTAAHKAVEDVLIELRDSQIGLFGPANGFVIRGHDGTPSEVMRLGTREGLRIAITAYLAATNQPTRHDCEVKTTTRGGYYGHCSCGWGTPILGAGERGQMAVIAQISNHTLRDQAAT